MATTTCVSLCLEEGPHISFNIHISLVITNAPVLRLQDKHIGWYETRVIVKTEQKEKHTGATCETKHERSSRAWVTVSYIYITLD